jgi:hypothetical protein
MGCPLRCGSHRTHQAASSRAAGPTGKRAAQVLRISRLLVQRARWRLSMTASRALVLIRVAWPVDTQAAAMRPFSRATARTGALAGPSARRRAALVMRCIVVGGTEKV